jgi:hypothetical protein
MVVSSKLQTGAIVFSVLTLFFLGAALTMRTYRIFTGMVFLTALMGTLMLGYSAYAQYYSTSDDIEPIRLYTCPDYWSEVKIKGKDGKPLEKACVPVMKNGDELYMATSVPRSGTTATSGTLISDGGKYNIFKRDRMIPLEQINATGDQTSSKTVFNNALCGCAQNIGWNEAQEECNIVGRGYERNDNQGGVCADIGQLVKDQSTLRSVSTNKGKVIDEASIGITQDGKEHPINNFINIETNLTI